MKPATITYTDGRTLPQARFALLRPTYDHAGRRWVSGMILVDKAVHELRKVSEDGEGDLAHDVEPGRLHRGA